MPWITWLLVYNPGPFIVLILIIINNITIIWTITGFYDILCILVSDKSDNGPTKLFRILPQCHLTGSLMSSYLCLGFSEAEFVSSLFVSSSSVHLLSKCLFSVMPQLPGLQLICFLFLRMIPVWKGFKKFRNLSPTGAFCPLHLNGEWIHFQPLFPSGARQQNGGIQARQSGYYLEWTF